jgi:hypothetical protein
VRAADPGSICTAEPRTSAGIVMNTGGESGSHGRLSRGAGWRNTVGLHRRMSVLCGWGLAEGRERRVGHWREETGRTSAKECGEREVRLEQGLRAEGGRISSARPVAVNLLGSGVEREHWDICQMSAENKGMCKATHDAALQHPTSYTTIWSRSPSRFGCWKYG